ncbi:hypothetical protein ABMA27_012217 [Loxostege sticticalis]|uniref:F-box domain-containing protein n=1 Tax=Loxostege sticticalis TaxID=481309 RepID=A0ABR3H0I8_LOXSC
METLKKDGENKKEFNDSGVQDVGKQAEHEERPAELLDLSDDVLLCILKYCSPRDLKALGFTCPRLGRLIRDRTLWTRVDARCQRTGRARLRWLLAHALGANTVELKLQGYALAARGCLGHVNRKRKEVEDEKAMRERQQESKQPAASTSEPGKSQDAPAQGVQESDPIARLQRLYAQSRCIGTPTWPEDGPTEVDPEDVVLLDGSCPGPQFTLTPCMLRQIRLHCSLSSLALEYCNINCNTTGINHFPPTLKRLSLKGAKCYNLPLDKSFLFNIQDYLPEIEYLDLSECEWLEPASLLPLSKVANLKHLIMRDCYRLSEFVAYASLATRYGFRKLEILDVRGSPVADSEVSAFGWLPALQELYISPAPRAPPHPRDHSHYRDEPLPPHSELEAWEMEEPEHFKIKPQTIDPPKPRADMTPEELEQLREYENNLCLHGLEYNLCTEGAWHNRQTTPQKRQADSEEKTQEESPTTTREPSSIPARVIEVSLRGGQAIRNARVLPHVHVHHSRYLREQFDEPESPNPPKQVKFTIDQKPGCSNAANTEKSPEVRFPQNRFLIPIERPCTKANCINAPSNEEGGKVKTNESESQDTGLKRKLEDPTPGCSKDVATNTPFYDEAGPSKKVKTEEAGPSKPDEKPGCSKDVTKDEVPSKSQENTDEAGPSVRPKNPDDDKSNDDCNNTTDHAKGCKCKTSYKYEYVRFRQNMEPVIVRRDPAEVDREEREREVDENREVRPRAHVLYVNVGQQLHTVYRLSIHNEPPIFYSFAGNSHLRFRPNVGNIFYTPPTPHLDATSLVSDSAVRRFGRADVDDVNVVHIGPRIGAGEPGSRPNRSSLRILSITGFRNITDRSLVHLATAAPDLRVIDFSETRVTAQGVENFKSLRPDCEVTFSEYVEREE